MNKFRRTDTQRLKVYRWEDHLFSNEVPYEDHEIEALIAQVCRDLRMPCPDIQHKKQMRSADASDTTIRFSANDPYFRKRSTVLHELAHYLNLKDDHHGGYFMRLYIEFLVRYNWRDRAGLIDSAAEHGIAVAHTFYIGVTRLDSAIPTAEEL